MKIKADRFQNLKDVELDVEGITIITGTNDTGKSALMRSIFFAIYNESGEYFIQEGEEECEVEFNFGDSDVKWRKSRNSGGEYWIDGEHFDKLGRGYFDEFLDSYGFQPLKAGKHEFYLHFWRQLEAMLILNRPNTRKFQILSDLFDVGKFNKVLEKIEKDKRSLSDQIDELAIIINRLEEETEKRDKQISRYDLFFEDNEDSYNELKELVDTYEQVTEINNKYQKVCKQLHSINKVLDQTSDIRDSVGQELKAHEEYLDRLSDLQDLYQEYSTCVKCLDQYEMVLQSRLEKDDIKSLKMDIAQYNILREYSQLVRYIDTVTSTVDQYTDLSLPSTDLFDRLKEIKKIHSDYCQIENRLNEIEENLQTDKKKQDDLEKEISSLEDELGVCPLCGQQFQNGENHG